MYFDGLGLIVQKNGDGGDAAQREGWAWFGAWIRKEVLGKPWDVQLPISFEGTIAQLEVDQSGNFRRHPQQWNDPKDFSRDQQIPIVAALGVWSLTGPLNRMWHNLEARHGLCQNGDLAGPDHLNLFNRARGVGPTWPGDIQLVANSGVRCAVAAGNLTDVGDDLNHIVNLLLAKLRSSNALVDNAIFLYSKNRPVCYGCYLGHYRQAYSHDVIADEPTMVQRIKAGIDSGWKPDCPRVLGALRWYFREESGGNPELAELYAPIIDEFLS